MDYLCKAGDRVRVKDNQGFTWIDYIKQCMPNEWGYRLLKHPCLRTDGEVVAAPFTFDDFETGHVIEYRNGSKWVVANDSFTNGIGCDVPIWWIKQNYSSDFKHCSNSELDIIEIKQSFTKIVEYKEGGVEGIGEAIVVFL